MRRTLGLVLGIGLLGCASDDKPSEAGDESTSTSTESGGDPGDGDGDPGVCDPAAFLGYGIGEDGWGVDSYCDSVFVCADANQAQQITDLLGATCLADQPGCAPGQQLCSIGGSFVTQATYDDACAALAIPGIDAVYCVVWGP